MQSLHNPPGISDIISNIIIIFRVILSCMVSTKKYLHALRAGKHLSFCCAGDMAEVGDRDLMTSHCNGSPDGLFGGTVLMLSQYPHTH